MAVGIRNQSPIRTGSATRKPFTSNLVGEFRLGYTRSIFKLTPLSVGFDITSLGLPSYLQAASTDAIFPPDQYRRLYRHRSRPCLTRRGRREHSRSKYSAFHVAETQPRHQDRLRHAVRSVQTRSDRIIRPALFNFGRAYTQGPDPASASATAGYGLASALLGSPDGGQFTIGPSLALLQTSYNWYLNDDWKITRTFSLSLGVRFAIPDAFQRALQSSRLFRPQRHRATHRAEGRSAPHHQFAPVPPATPTGIGGHVWAWRGPSCQIPCSGPDMASSSLPAAVVESVPARATWAVGPRSLRVSSSGNPRCA